MKKKSDNYERLQLGLHLWSGSAPHLGRSFKESQAHYPVRAADHDKNFDLFQSTDVWNYDGWLITSTSLAGAIVRCNVRKGTQVGILVLEADALFFHNNPDLPHEEYSVTDPVTVTSRMGVVKAA